MIKRLKTLEQIKDEWGHNYVEDRKKDIRFYSNGVLDSHITFKMKKYFGKNIDVKSGDGYYEWYFDNNNSLDRSWYFKDSWFEPDVELLDDSLFEI